MNLLCINYSSIFNVGAWLTFAVGIIVAVFEIRKSRRVTYINTITEIRKEYLKDLRNLVSQFSYLANTLNPDMEKLKEISYQIKLMMNPARFENWDRQAIILIDNIIVERNKKDIEKFVALMQSWFALEWDGIKRESESRLGNLSSKSKNKLRDSLYLEFQTYWKTIE